MILTRNREANLTNKYQTDAKKVLCVCSAGMLRSPTCANVLHKEFGYNTRAVGVVEDYALIPIDLGLVLWADEVLVVEERVLDLFSKELAQAAEGKLVVLDLPDVFAWGDPQLEEYILEQYPNKKKENKNGN